MGEATEIIDKRSYVCRPMLCMDGLEIAAKIASVAGPTLMRLISSEELGQKKLTDPEVLAEAEPFFRRLNEAPLRQVVPKLMSTIYRLEPDGAETDMGKAFDFEFRGDLVGMLRVLFFALRKNIGPFSLTPSKAAGVAQK